MSMSVFWVEMPCGVVCTSQCFGETYCVQWLISLMLEAVSISDTSVNFCHITGRNIPEGSHHHVPAVRTWIRNEFVSLWMYKVRDSSVCILENISRVNQSMISAFSNNAFKVTSYTVILSDSLYAIRHYKPHVKILMTLEKRQKQKQQQH
jgi:hypothetical protein